MGFCNFILIHHRLIMNGLPIHPPTMHQIHNQMVMNWPIDAPINSGTILLVAECRLHAKVSEIGPNRAALFDRRA